MQHPTRRIPAAIQPSVMDENDAVQTLRAALRVSSDYLEDLFLDGPPKKGKSKDDRDDYLGWTERVHHAIAQARAALDATEEFSNCSANDLADMSAITASSATGANPVCSTLTQT